MKLAAIRCKIKPWVAAHFADSVNNAELVNHWFGAKLEEPLQQILFEGKEKDLLAKAVKLETDQQEKEEKPFVNS